MICARCHRDVHEVERASFYADGPICLNCYDKLAPQSNSIENRERAALSSSSSTSSQLPSLSDRPHPSSLVPSFSPTEVPVVPGDSQGGEEAEVEWLLREEAAGRLVPEAVTLPPVPDGSSVFVARVADFFALVYGLRLAADDDRPVPFASGWVAAKLGIPKPTVHRALRKLADAGVLVQVGALPGRSGKRGTHLWLAGDPVEDESVGVEAAVADEADQPRTHAVDEALVLGAELAVANGPAGAPLRGADQVGGRQRHTGDRTSSDGAMELDGCSPRWLA